MALCDTVGATVVVGA